MAKCKIRTKVGGEGEGSIEEQEHTGDVLEDELDPEQAGIADEDGDDEEGFEGEEDEKLEEGEGEDGGGDEGGRGRR